MIINDEQSTYEMLFQHLWGHLDEVDQARIRKQLKEAEDKEADNGQNSRDT